MNYNENWKNKCGIYSLTCKINNKRYIGKSKNLYYRLKHHVTSLNRKIPKHENQYLINAWDKYGEDNFVIEILEYCEYSELSNKELYYILKYKSNDKKYGYNLRLDTDLGMIPSDETRLKLSKAQINRQKNMNNEDKKLQQQKSIDMWKNRNSKEIDDIMLKVAKTRSKYIYYQYDLNNNLIDTFNSIKEILLKYPTFHRTCIYNNIYEEKKTAYNFIWKRILK